MTKTGNLVQCEKSKGHYGEHGYSLAWEDKDSYDEVAEEDQAMSEYNAEKEMAQNVSGSEDY